MLKGIIDLHYHSAPDVKPRKLNDLEREYAQPVGSRFVSNLESNVEAIQAIGPEHIILASDSGQMNTPFWRDAVQESYDYYRSAGISEGNLHTMMVTNPAKMLGLDSSK